MARPIAYDKETVLDGATDLFWRQGYEATTLQDICDATGFNRHSLYHTFGNKEQLFLAALKNYAGDPHKVSETPVAEGGDLNSIRHIFERRLPWDIEGRGCLITSTLNEKTCVEPEAAFMAVKFIKRLEEWIYHCLQNAQEQGDIPASKDCRALAKYVVVVLQGLGTMSKVGLTLQEANDIVENTMAFLQNG